MKIGRKKCLLSGQSEAVTSCESVSSTMVSQGLSQNSNSLVLSDDKNVDQQPYIWMKVERKEVSGWVESVSSTVVPQGLSQNSNSLVLSDDKNVDQKPYIWMKIRRKEVSGRSEAVTNSESVSGTVVAQ